MALTAIGGSARGVQLAIAIQELNTALGAGQVSAQLLHQIVFAAELPSGTTDGSIDRVYSDAISFTTSNTDLDLVSGVTSKLNGATLTFTDVAGVCVVNSNPIGSTGNLVIGNAAAPLALFSAGTATHTVRPNGVYLWTDSVGITPAGGSTDVLRIVASAGTVPGLVMIWGRST